MSRLTLIQLLESKKALIDNLNQTPRSVVEYEIKRYCTLPLTTESKIVELKPKQIVTVEWIHDAALGVENVSITDKTGSLIHDRENVEFTGDRLQKWLVRYAKQGKNINSKT